ncbi:divergent polysaccharide deacetylase family protein [Undibacter mobilis]|uniref:Divergent polysaccharide deacetylase family protein n=2 Tax=Undibacter mobilis TaxID=2292256 RepID=A0A371BDQ5_9BRAD|nr:divergent polysaccharide deacetylase family protein [Undibacter mobilis]
MPQMLAAVLALGGVIVAGWAMVANDPLGGEPMAVVSTRLEGSGDTAGNPGDGREKAHRDGPGSGAVAKIPDAGKTPDGAKTVTIIDGSSGKRQEVVIPGTGTPDSADKAMAKAIAVKGPDGKPAATPAKPDARPDAKPDIKADFDPAKLSEKIRYGAIPKIGPDGAKPFAAFAQARTLPPALKDRPRIAIILTGMGISASGTADAFSLPASATFALAPYAVDVARLAERARDEGHELLLQTPMEPFEYPDNDPGPQTLLTSLTPDQNIDRLHWLMSRMQGYVGVVSFMGARFLTAESALAPVLSETAKRGLIFVDGGASQRSVAGQLAAARNMAFAKADIVIDAVPTPVEIERALARLEIVAREGGTAVGIANAQPGTITRVAEWMAKVESRGFVLVPISMIVAKSKST